MLNFRCDEYKTKLLWWDLTDDNYLREQEIQKMMHHCEYVWNLFYLVIRLHAGLSELGIKTSCYGLFGSLQPLAAAALNRDVLWSSHDHHLLRSPLVDILSLFRQRQPQQVILRRIEVLVSGDFTNDRGSCVSIHLCLS